MITFRLATKEDLSLFLSSRFEMMRVVNRLPDDYCFGNDMVENTKEAFFSVDHDTVFAMDDDVVVGCATACYHTIMPTRANPSGKRAYVLNVHTKESYRGRGIATKLMTMLLEECRRRGVTEVTLDASVMGKPIYEKLGFAPQEHYEHMVAHLK